MKFRQQLILTLLILIATSLVSLFIYDIFTTDNLVNGTYQANAIGTNRVTVSIRDVDNITSNSNNTITFSDGAPGSPASWIVPTALLSALVVGVVLVYFGAKYIHNQSQI